MEDTAGDRTGDTRSRLLDEAARSFADRGFRATSVSAVARTVGVSPSTAYFHFADKRTLFVAAFDREAEALCDSIIGAPEAIGGGYWETVLLRLADDIPTRPLVYRVVSGLEPGLLHRLFDGAFSRRIRAAMATSLRLAQAQGSISSDLDVDHAALGLETIVISLVLSAVQAGAVGDGDRALAVRYVLRQALRGATA